MLEHAFHSFPAVGEPWDLMAISVVLLVLKEGLTLVCV